MRAPLLAALLAAALASPLSARQDPEPSDTCTDSARLGAMDFATAERDVARILQAAGALSGTSPLLRRASTERERPVCRSAATAGLEWALGEDWSGQAPLVRPLPVGLRLEGNSEYRKDRNNGALQGGVGPAFELGAGAEFRWKWFSAALAPRLVAESNDDFTTPDTLREGFSPFAPAFQTIDVPRRFGTGTHGQVNLGESYLRAATRHLELGVSTENVWLGSAQVYPLLLSSTAPGFFHVFLGSNQPVDLWIARVAVRGMLGRLRESDYFDEDDSNDTRLVAITMLEVQPRFIPGLALGVARVNHEVIPSEGLSIGDYLGRLLEVSPTFAGGGNTYGSNAIGGLMARWTLPAAGFEAYAEWAREDTPYDLRDLIEEPDWTQAYTLGFQQLVALEGVRLRWYGELVHLGESAPTRAGKGFASFYTHTVVTQGHTHEGQILGASPGPGSDAQILGVDGFHQWGQSGLWVERTRYDEDTYYRRWAKMYGESRHDVEIGVGVRHAMNAGPVRLAAELLYNSRANRDFIGLQHRETPRTVDGNLGFKLRAAWTPSFSWGPSPAAGATRVPLPPDPADPAAHLPSRIRSAPH